MQGCFFIKRFAFKIIYITFAKTIINKDMIKVTAKEISGLKNGEISTSEFAEKMVKNYSAYEIALALSEFISMNDVVSKPTKIAVTSDELNAIVALFRVKGTSTRGRKPKNK